MRIERGFNYLLLIAMILFLMFALANGQDEGVIKDIEIQEEETTPTPLITNLDVLLIDKINGSAIQFSNSAVVLAGKMKIGEDSFDYNNTFIAGDVYEITIMLERKDGED